MGKRVLWLVIAVLILGNVFQMIYYNSLFAFTVLPDEKIAAVPDEETALIMAKTVLAAIYGEEILFMLELEVEFEVTFDRIRRAWVVQGVFPEFPEGYYVMGVVPRIVIRERDARIMSIRFR